MEKKGITWRKVWYFIWEDDSILSWIVNILLAFVLIKFVVYPGLGFLLQTSHPVVAVVSESMEHQGSYESWWATNQAWYVQNDIDRNLFDTFPLRNGFNKGDIMLLMGAPPDKVEIGDVIVFYSKDRLPIIHRVTKIKQNGDDIIYETKGDNNNGQIINPTLDERNVNSEAVIGKATVRIPYLGYIKIIVVSALEAVLGR